MTMTQQLLKYIRSAQIYPNNFEHLKQAELIVCKMVKAEMGKGD